MKHILAFIFAIILLVASSSAFATVTCEGMSNAVYGVVTADVVDGTSPVPAWINDAARMHVQGKHPVKIPVTWDTTEYPNNPNGMLSCRYQNDGMTLDSHFPACASGCGYLDAPMVAVDIDNKKPTRVLGKYFGFYSSDNATVPKNSVKFKIIQVLNPSAPCILNSDADGMRVPYVYGYKVCLCKNRNCGTPEED